jgi:hypothetical protein
MPLANGNVQLENNTYRPAKKKRSSCTYCCSKGISNKPNRQAEKIAPSKLAQRMAAT